MAFIDSLAGGLGSAIGGIASAWSQDKANKRNIAMQRETNRLNYQMFQEQNAFNEKMFNAANEWNSPINQRKMLEDAGFNPASLFGANIGAANPVNSGSPNAAVSPQMQPIDFNQIASAAIQSFAALKETEKVDAEIRKTDEETKGFAIDNETKGEINQATLKKLGLDSSKVQAETENIGYKNAVDAASVEADVLTREETANRALADAQKAQSDAVVAGIKARLEEDYGPKRAELEYQNLQKEFELKAAQIGTENAQQYMYRKTGDANWLNAKTAQAVGGAQIRDLNASANLKDSQKYRQDLENKVYEELGYSKAAAELVSIVYDNDVKSVEARLERWHAENLDGKHGRARQVLHRFYEDFVRNLQKINPIQIKL